jgi:signal transduction histidine kinase
MRSILAQLPAALAIQVIDRPPLRQYGRAVAVVTPQRRVQLLGLFARGLAHEARNALNVMALHVQALSDRGRAGRPPADEGVDRSVQALRTQIGKVDQLIARFCQFAVPRDPQAPAPELAEALSALVGLCEVEARRTHVTLTAELEPGLTAAAGVDDLLADLLPRLLELPGLEGSALRVSLAARGPAGRLDLEVGAPLPDSLTTAAQELARRAGCESSHEERSLSFTCPVSRRAR